MVNNFNMASSSISSFSDPASPENMSSVDTATIESKFMRLTLC